MYFYMGPLFVQTDPLHISMTVPYISASFTFVYSSFGRAHTSFIVHMGPPADLNVSAAFYMGPTFRQLTLHARCLDLVCVTLGGHPQSPRISFQELDFHAPLILLLVKLLEKNPDLRQVMALAVDMDELMASLLFIMYDDTVNKRGLLKPVTCILLLLSTDQAFCKMLSKPFAGTLPVALPKFNGNLVCSPLPAPKCRNPVLAQSADPSHFSTCTPRCQKYKRTADTHRLPAASI